MTINRLERVAAAIFRAINRWRVWHRLPFVLAVANLFALRIDLSGSNLFDTETSPPDRLPPEVSTSPLPDRRWELQRSIETLDGNGETRFGRNMPLAQTFGETPPALYDPNPRLISRELLARREFVPAPTVNVLVAGLVAVHGPRLAESRRQRKGQSAALLPRPEATTGRARNDDLADVPGRLGARRRGAAGDLPQRRDPLVGRIANVRLRSGVQHRVRSRIRQALLPRRQAAFGRDRSSAARSRGPRPIRSGPELAGVNGNWWIGLSVMHTLFMREHNTIVDRLRIEYPDKDGEWLFQKARLVNAALLAKIHTTEWTPALMQMPERRNRHARQLVGAARRGVSQRLRAPRAARFCPAYPLSRGSSCRSLCDDRGVHRGISDALSHPGLVLLPPPHR